MNVTNATFAWSPNSGLSNSTAQNPTATPLTTTTYEVVVTNASGCVKTDSVEVVIYPLPDVDFSVDDVCINEVSQFNNLSAISSGGIGSFVWDFGDGNSGSATNESNVYTSDGVYAIQLIATSNEGCKDSISQSTTVHPLPIADFNFNNDCQDKDIAFTDASTVSAGSIAGWNWDFGNGNTSTNQFPTPQNYSNSGLFNVNLEVASDFGCLDDTTQVVEIYPVPIANFAFDSVCFGNPISFTDLSSANGNYPIATHFYQFSDGQTSNESNPAIIFTQHGFYDATLTVSTDVGCIDQVNLGDAVVYPLPVSQFDPAIKNCFNDTTWFEDQSSVPDLLNDQIVSWDWDFDDGNGSSAADTANWYQNHGIYNVSLITQTDKGCSDTVQNEVEIYPLPDVSFVSDYTEGCQPFRVLFEETVTIPEPYTISQYVWNLGDGDGPINTQNPMNVYNNDSITDLRIGQYTVSLQATSGNGCVSSDTVENYITEYPKPDALFAAKPWVTDVLNTEIDFEDLSSPNVTEWYWDFGDANSSLEQNPTNRFPENVGEYLVTQYVTTEFGCIDTISAKVEIEPIFTFYIPNAFTPDADGVNEEFFGDGEGYTSYTMSIYNRWGEQIFYSNDPEKKWDGTYMGKQVEQGVYIYHFYVLDWKNNDHEYRGHVTLMR